MELALNFKDSETCLAVIASLVKAGVMGGNPAHPAGIVGVRLLVSGIAGYDFAPYVSGDRNIRDGIVIEAGEVTGV